MSSLDPKVKIAADATCFIDAVDARSRSYPYLQKIIELRDQGLVQLFISRHSLHEIRNSRDAIELANSCDLLPHYPIGTWDEQIGHWDDRAGTWNDAKSNQIAQEHLQKLANSGTSVRDRGAYIDALRAGVDIFMTSDEYELRILTPKQVVEELMRKLTNEQSHDK